MFLFLIKKNNIGNLPSSLSEQVESAWDRGKTVRANLDDMGLVYDLNKSLKIPKTKESLTVDNDKVEKMELAQTEVIAGKFF